MRCPDALPSENAYVGHALFLLYFNLRFDIAEACPSRLDPGRLGRGWPMISPKLSKLTSLSSQAPEEVLCLADVSHRSHRPRKLLAPMLSIATALKAALRACSCK